MPYDSITPGTPGTIHHVLYDKQTKWKPVLGSSGDAPAQDGDAASRQLWIKRVKIHPIFNMRI
jgi:hypothetical protein